MFVNIYSRNRYFRFYYRKLHVFDHPYLISEASSAGTDAFGGENVGFSIFQADVADDSQGRSALGLAEGGSSIRLRIPALLAKLANFRIVIFVKTRDLDTRSNGQGLVAYERLTEYNVITRCLDSKIPVG